MSPLGLVVAAGLINWLVTSIIVESVMFEDVRKVTRKAAEKIGKKAIGCSGCRKSILFSIGHKVGYFLQCQICTGVWVGWALAAILPGPITVGGVMGSVVMNGLLYKAVGHVVLEGTACIKASTKIMESKMTVNPGGLS